MSNREMFPRGAGVETEHGITGWESDLSVNGVDGLGRELVPVAEFPERLFRDGDVLGTPPVLTGGQKNHLDVQLHVDWLSVTFPDIDWWEAQALFDRYYGSTDSEWLDLESGSYGYTKGKLGPGGVRLWWGAEGRTDVHISLPGKALSAMNLGNQAGFIASIVDRGAKATRVDLAFDDYDRTYEPVHVKEACTSVEEGGTAEAVTHASKILFLEESEVNGGPTGPGTLYIGSKESRQRLRVYDKYFESDGAINSIRWELQTRDAAADGALRQLASSIGSWSETFASRLVSFVDFRDPETGDRPTRRERSSWFAQLVGLILKSSVYEIIPIQTVYKLYDWMERQLSPSFAVLEQVFGGLQWAERLVGEGRRRMTSKHWRLITEANDGTLVSA